MSDHAATIGEHEARLDNHEEQLKAIWPKVNDHGKQLSERRGRETVIIWMLGYLMVIATAVALKYWL